MIQIAHWILQRYKDSGLAHLPLKIYLTKLWATKNIAETKAMIVKVCKTFRGMFDRTYESDGFETPSVDEHPAVT